VVILSTILLILVVVFNVGYRQSLPDSLEVDQSQLKMIDPPTPENSNSNALESDRGKEAPIKPFNPNNLSKNGWKDLGFSEKQAESILDYKNNYGPFEKKADVERLYVVSEEMYQRLAPHMYFNQPKQVAMHESLKVYEKEEIAPISINAAVDSQLMQLPNIGPVYAERIISYRKKIGGFVDIRQIESLYISDEAKQTLQDHTFIDIHKINKININTANKATIKNIPESSWEIVALILKARDEEPLVDLSCIPETLLEKEEREIFLKYINF